MHYRDVRQRRTEAEKKKHELKERELQVDTLLEAEKEESELVTSLWRLRLLSPPLILFVMI